MGSCSEVVCPVVGVATCDHDESCCGSICCGPGTACGNNPGDPHIDVCCPQDHPVACGDVTAQGCYVAGSTCCGSLNTACGPGEVCQGPAAAPSCCPSAKACGSACCGAGESCQRTSTGAQVCCATPLCGDQCCGSGAVCSNNTCCTAPFAAACCATDSLCGQDCCGPDEVCQNGSQCCLPSQQCGSICCGRSGPLQVEFCAAPDLCCPIGATACNGSCCPGPNKICLNNQCVFKPTLVCTGTTACVDPSTGLPLPGTPCGIGVCDTTTGCCVQPPR
jgi:hypothetical protein